MSHGSASGGVATPAQRFVLAFKLSHESSATTTELVSIRETLCYVKTQPPHFWTIFCDLMSALQSLMWVMQRSRCGQLAFDIFSTLCGLLQSGHQVAFKWILVHCGVPGNESADAAAQTGHNIETHVDIPFATPDARVVVPRIGITIAKGWWNDPRSSILAYIGSTSIYDSEFPPTLAVHSRPSFIAWALESPTQENAESVLDTLLHRTASRVGTPKQSHTYY